MKLAVPDFGYTAGGWRVDRHPRFVVDLTGDGRADVIGFGDAGVRVATNRGDGTFDPQRLVLGDFGFVAGGWRVDKHPRVLADLTGDGRPDIVGFGDAGVLTAANTGGGNFGPVGLAVPDFGYTAGGWRVEKHPRTVADLTGDGRGDVVGFGEAGVWVALNHGDGTFAAPTLAVPNFGYTAGGWRVEKHPRFLADLTGNHCADIIGFGDAGVWVALNHGDGTFAAPTLAVANFGYTAGGWRVDKHPRLVADLTGDGRADIIGFGDAGVWVALNTGSGTFTEPKLVLDDFGSTIGGWRVDKHVRLLADLTGDGLPDIVGFGDAGVLTAHNTGGGFGPVRRVIPNFAYDAGGWRVDKHPRFAADLTGDGRADIAGCGEAGVWTELNRGDGTFSQTFVRRNIWDLEAGGPWDPVTLAYARAVRAMQAKPITDPTSWQYQAAIHGRAGAAPAGAVWNQCQHGSWYFLPWHRAYLHYFEKIVRAEVVAQGGPADWALPYWDYDNPGQAALPPAFREPTLPDGSANPLFVTQRGAGWNTGAQLPPSVRSSTAAMAATTFTPPPSPGFGGGRTTPQHFFGAAGDLEFTPHNAVHSLIGGFMGDPDRAALDPIFWLHHANVDRLWAVWLNRGGGRADPPDAAWRGQSFPFIDQDGSQVSLVTSAVLDTVADLQYTYADVLQADADARPEQEVGAVAADEPELVGASEQALDLVGAPAAVEVALDGAASAEAVAAVADDARPDARVYLNLEDIEAERNPSTVYEVYVAAPDAPARSAPSFVGTISFFGVEHVARDAEGGHGMRRTFDITPVVARLREQGVWSDERLLVSLRPVLPILPPGTAEDEESDEAAESVRARTAPVRIGRVSVFRG